MSRERSTSRNRVLDWLPAIAAIATIIGLFFGFLSPRLGNIESRLGGMEEAIRTIHSDIGFLGGEIGFLKGFLEGRLTPVSVNPAGGTIPLTFNPRFTTLETSAGWINGPASLIREPQCAARAGLGTPEGYKSVDWSFGFTIPIPLLKPVSIIFRYTEEDLQQTGAGGGEDLVIFQWQLDQGWVPLSTVSNPKAQTVKAEITEPGCFLLAAKS